MEPIIRFKYRSRHHFFFGGSCSQIERTTTIKLKMNGQHIQGTPMVVDYWRTKNLPPRLLFFLTHMHAGMFIIVAMKVLDVCHKERLYCYLGQHG